MRLMLAISLLSISAYGHDFWIEPSTFRPAVGQAVTVSLRVGQNFTGDPVPRSAQLLESFTIRDRAGERPIGGFENLDPAGYLRIEKAGLAMIGYRSKPNPLELTAEKFSEFLQTEGLQLNRDLRKPDREHFFRYAKALVGNGSSGFDRRFGYRYEIVPETNPLSASRVRLRLLLEGKPLAGALVTAIDRQGARLTARTDSHGRVMFSLPKSGVWLIKSVWIVPAPSGSDADWESLWASLIFER
jgi:uncharacterized GH25 family protein